MRLPSSLLRRGRAAVAVLAGLALTAACGSSPSEGGDRLTPVAAVQAAARVTADAGSSRFALSSVTEVGGQTIEVAGEGLFDPATRVGSAVLQLPGGAGELEYRFVGDDLYLTVPGQPGFYRLSLADLVGTELESAAQPTGSLEVLEAVSDDVRETGEEEVRGEATTRYEGTLDGAKALEQLGGATRALAEQGLDAGTLPDVPFTAWLDDDGRLRKLTSVVELPASEATAGTALTATTTLELFDFGVDVAVEPPPADQVQDGGPLLDALRGSAG